MTDYIVVGVDGSESALRATRWAAREAAVRDVDLRLVHVRELPLLLPPSDLYAWELTDQGNKWLVAARDAALAAAPSLDVHTGLRTGQPAEELVVESEDAALVVVGSRGLGGFRSLLLGSVANVLTAHAHCPVVVLRGDPPDHGPIVVGVDRLPSAAVDFALAAAAVHHAEVVAVHAWTYEDLAGPRSPATTGDWDEIASAEHRDFDKRLALLCGAHPDVPVRSVFHRGRPVDVLLEQSEHAQLVVVGADGHHRMPAGTVGSTSYAVIHHATCPVAVVRGDRSR